MQKLRKPKFSIRYKFLAVITVLLAFCVSIYLAVASKTFKDDKKQLIFDLNSGMVTNLSSEIESVLRSYSDKMTLFALLHNKGDQLKSVVDDLLQNEPNIAHITLQTPNENSSSQLSYTNKEFLATYGINEEYFLKTLTQTKPIPISAIQQSGEEIWNATIENGPPIIGYGKSVIAEDSSGKPVERWQVIAYIRADHFLKSLPTEKLYNSYIANNHGEILVHRDPKFMVDHKSGINWRTMAKAKQMTSKTMVTEYTQDGEEYLGAFSQAYKGKILIVSEAVGKRAFSAIEGLLTRSLVFGLMVMTLAFLAALLLSRSLTHPLQTLVQGMSEVSNGNLSTQISVNTRDEISVLAESFNGMIRDLKTSRTQLEEINRDLEQKVLDRTHQLAEQNRAIKETQEALLKTSRLAAIGEVAGHAAHEVLNPLTSLLTRARRVQNKIEETTKKDAGLLKEIQGAWAKDFAGGGFETLVGSWKNPSGIDPKKSLWDEDMQNIVSIVSNLESQIDEFKRDTDFILNEGQRINKIVSGMRSLSVVRAELKSCSAHATLNECINIMADLYDQSSVKIKLFPEAENDIVVIDKDEFIQAVTNLLRNSLQAIRSSEMADKGLVSIRTSIEDNRFFIRVTDNGPGISSENQSKLFQTQFTTKPSDEGTGLGLGISRRFIRAFEGDLEFENSIANKETTFRIWLPLKNKEVAV